MKSEYNFKVTGENGHTHDMHDLGIWVESFRIYSPNVERITSENTSIPGARLKSSKIKVRKVHILMQVETDNISDYDELKHLIYRIFLTESPLVFERDLRPDRKIHALYEGDYDIDNITPSDGTFELFLNMLDPYLIGPEDNLTIGTSFNTFEIKSDDKKTPWTSRTVFDASATQYVLETNEGGKVILNFNFIAGDVLEIDYHKRKVTLNGDNLAVAIAFETKWAPLTPGYMSIKASHTTTLSYMERYI